MVFFPKVVQRTGSLGDGNDEKNEVEEKLERACRAMRLIGVAGEHRPQAGRQRVGSRGVLNRRVRGRGGYTPRSAQGSQVKKYSTSSLAS